MIYCGKTEQCSYDVTRKLQQWKVPPDLYNDILDRLISDKFIDHQRYAQSFVRGKLRYNHWGKKKIAFMLHSKQIEKQAINNAIEAIDEKEYNDIINKQLLLKNNSIKEEESLKRKAKLMNFAASRGYEAEIVKQFINQIERNENT